MKSFPFLRRHAGLFLIGLGVFTTAVSAPAAKQGDLTKAAEFPRQQVTGVAVSPEGRRFVNFPFWSDEHTDSVVEVGRDGRNKPFPDAAWNAPAGDAARRFVCVQSVYADEANHLWILDTGSPKMKGVVPGGAKLLEVNLGTNQVGRIYSFGADIAAGGAYLNDVRVDLRREYAFITESGVGSLVVLNLQTGQGRRVLFNDASVKAEPVQMTVEGNKLFDSELKKPASFAADTIAYDAEGGWLYFKPLTGYTLYRVSAQDLIAAAADPAAVRGKVQKVANVPVSDGAEFHDGAVYLTAPEKNAVIRYDVARGTQETVAQSPDLKWPDSLAFGADGTLFVTTSQIHLTPKYNFGQDKVREPYRLWTINVGAGSDSPAKAERASGASRRE